MIIRRTLPEENRRVNEIFAIAFEQPLDENNPPIRESTMTYAAFTDDMQMMSTVTFTDFDVNFDGNTCKTAGAGGVATLPQYRRGGSVRGCFTKALPELYKDGYDFSYLFPFSTIYYRKFGYESCVRKYQTVVNLGLLDPPKTEGSLVLAECGSDFSGAVKAVDAVWESKYNMAVRHDEEYYSWVLKCDPAVKQEFTYIYFSKNGTPKAYTTFRKADEPDGRNLVCRHFCFTDKEGYNGLMSLFRSFASDHRFVRFDLPADPGMFYLMPEWSLGAVKFTVVPAGMVRVINVKSVLKKARYKGSGHIVLKITDEIIPENCGCFEIRFTDGRADSVAQTSSTPDAILGIATFSALITGVCQFEEANGRLEGFEILNIDACFDRVFYQKPMMIRDYF